MLCILEDFLPQLDRFLLEQETKLDLQSFIPEARTNVEPEDVSDGEGRLEPQGQQEHVDAGTSIDENYVRALEMYCLLKQRLLDIVHNWKTVVQEALPGHGKHTGIKYVSYVV